MAKVVRFCTDLRPSVKVKTRLYDERGLSDCHESQVKVKTQLCDEYGKVFYGSKVQKDSDFYL